jgi:hypothetical protein
MNMIEKQKNNTTSDSVVENNTTHEEGEKHEQSITSVASRMSAHAIKWIWTFKGTTTRKPDKSAKMRGWVKRVYYWGGSTIVLNVNTMEIFTRSRAYSSTPKMIYANWSKADKLAREFSEFAQIAITPVKTNHPADVISAHLVINNKEINGKLLPKDDKRKFIGKNEPYPTAIKVGAIEDGSHTGKVELVGKQSVEGGFGMDWLLLDYPRIVKQSLEMNEKFSKNLELHLSVLNEIRDAERARAKSDAEMSKTMKRIRESLEVKK